MGFKGLSGDSLFLQRKLGGAISEKNRSIERLSSGLRINHASDDPASLALAMSLRTDARVFAQGIRNVNDGISLYNVASEAVSQLTSISMRIKELAEQASNTTFTYAQRKALDKEAQALSAEYSRIISTTSFNGIKLLDGTSNILSIQAGSGTSSTLSFNSNITLDVHGDGTFTGGTSQATGASSSPRELALGDLNNDGIVDLVTADDTSGTFSTMMGNGDGTFRARTATSAGLRVYDIEMVDVNNDGNLDVVTSDYNASGPGYIKTFLGNGDGSFKVGITSSVTSYNWFMSPGDVNGDGNLDMIVTESYGQDIAIMIGDGRGGFTKSGTVSDGGGTFVYNNSVGDFNGDGKLDIVGSGDQISLYLGNGDGTFKFVATPVNPSAIAILTTGDYNGDGKTDVATFNASNQVQIHLSNGDGTFKAVGVTPTSTIWGLSSSDLNGDGNEDIIVALQGTTSQTGIILSNGDGTFKALVTYSASASSIVNAQTAEAADFNGDGAQDVILLDGFTNSFKVFYGNVDPSSRGDVIALDPITISTVHGAKSALRTLTANLESLNLIQSRLGAYSSRLSVVNDVLISSREATLTAYSRIMDVDVAAETAALVSSGIRSQAATALLAQFNQQRNIVLSLISDL